MVNLLQEIIVLGCISNNIEFSKVINEQVNKNTELESEAPSLSSGYVFYCVTSVNSSQFPSVYRNNKETKKSDSLSLIAVDKAN